MPNDIVKKNVAVYIRVSSMEDTDFNDKHQLASIKWYIKARQEFFEQDLWNHIFYDINVWWATTPEERPWMTALFNELKIARELWAEKPFDVIIVHRIDRFARKVKVLLDIVELLESYEVDFVSTYESIDTTTAFWKAMLQIMWVFAELERDMIAQKTHSWLRIKKQEWWLAREVYGYKRDENDYPVIYEPEANIVQDIFDMFVYKDMKVSEICNDLAHRKIFTPTFNKNSKINSQKKINRAAKGPYAWNDWTIRTILTNEMYIWIYYYNKSKRIPHPLRKWKYKQIDLPKSEWKLSNKSHVGLVDKEIFSIAQEKLQWLTKKPRLPTKKPESEYLLSWILRCDACKDFPERKSWMMSRVWTKWWNSAEWVYKCKWKDKGNVKRCTCIELPKGALEQEVLKYIKQFLKNPEVIHNYLDNWHLSEARLKTSKQKLEYLKQNIKNNEWVIKKLKALKLEMSSYSNEEYIKDVETKKLENTALKKEAKILLDEINGQLEINKYQKTLELASSLYGKEWSAVFEDQEKFKLLLKILVKEIIIYSAPKPAWFVIAWPKKEDQLLPSRISIVFKLPQEILNIIHNQLVYVFKKWVVTKEWEMEALRKFTPYNNNYITNNWRKLVELSISEFAEYLSKLTEWKEFDSLSLNVDDIVE